jgi:bifunctional ADP-heptose synthase (sugar kinase/adenylyltransferase)
VSGAGDTVTALYTGAIAAGASPELAGDLANLGAGIVVSEVGTVPIRRDSLLKEIERL